MLPLLTRDVHEVGLICQHCSETLVPFDEISASLQAELADWASRYAPVHAVAHWDDRQRKAAGNYDHAYETAAECYAEIADHDPSFPICIEYKISEPRVRSLLGNAGETAAFCQIVNRDNLGVTLDVGHALFANENASQSAALLAKAKRLFYVHLNDNDGRADWDLLPGAVHTWELVEFIYTLKKLGYDDWMTFDIVPKELDPVEFFAAAARLTRKYEALSGRIDAAAMAALQVDKNAARTLEYLHTLI